MFPTLAIAVLPSPAKAQLSPAFPIHFRFFFPGPTAGPLRAGDFHWGLREARLSSVASRSPPSRRALVQRTGPTKYPKPKPSAAGSVWKGGARERSEKSPSGGYERSGLCDDARQRRGKKHSPNLTRRREKDAPRRRGKVTGAIYKKNRLSSVKKRFLTVPTRKADFQISTYPRG